MSDSSERNLIERAAALLKAGELVSFPTETVYGLGADASNPEALRKLYAAKGRPSSHPVIVHVAGAEQAKQWVSSLPESFTILAERFWPGPLTMVMPRAEHVPDQVTGGQDTVALRVPAHPLALELLAAFEGGVAAPSANRFGRLSPTKADDVRREFGDAVALVLDGGPCAVGIESTILDLSSGTARILRPGMVIASQIEEVLGIEVTTHAAETAPALRVPGSLPGHYAPVTPLMLLPWEELQTKMRQFVAAGSTVGVLSFKTASDVHGAVNWHQARLDADDYAQQLYAVLRKLDQLHGQYILVEEPPREAQWIGIHDRLRRAANGNSK
ncbi:MAG TPA: L-threonylcarbamoyladenylate synthase [Planktothrix sp.]